MATKMKSEPVISLSKTKIFAVTLAQFASEQGVSVRDAAELVTLAERAFKAGERDCNEGSEASDKSYERAHARFRERAEALGFGVQWSGLWPTLLKDGREVYLPSE
jgi:hypothetical protein